MLINVRTLTNCLAQKGWKKDSKSFKAGHSFFLKDYSHAMQLQELAEILLKSKFTWVNEFYNVIFTFI